MSEAWIEKLAGKVESRTGAARDQYNALLRKAVDKGGLADADIDRLRELAVELQLPLAQVREHADAVKRYAEATAAATDLASIEAEMMDVRADIAGELAVRAKALAAVDAKHAPTLGKLHDKLDALKACQAAAEGAAKLAGFICAAHPELFADINSNK